MKVYIAVDKKGGTYLLSFFTGSEDTRGDVSVQNMSMVLALTESQLENLEREIEQAKGRMKDGGEQNASTSNDGSVSKTAD